MAIASRKAAHRVVFGLSLVLLMAPTVFFFFWMISLSLKTDVENLAYLFYGRFSQNATSVNRVFAVPYSGNVSNYVNSSIALDDVVRRSDDVGFFGKVCKEYLGVSPRTFYHLFRLFQTVGRATN